MCYIHIPGLEPRFVSGDDGTISQISSQSVLPPLLSALRNPSRACPLPNAKPLKKQNTSTGNAARIVGNAKQ
jgi:hypothetical protein